MRDPVLHILPTRLRVQAALDRAAADALARAPDAPAAVLLGPRVVTFPRLVDAICRELPAPPRPLGDTARRLLAAEVVRAYLTGTRRYFATQLPYRGFVEELLALVDDLKRARVGPERFRTTLAGAATNGNPARHRELADLYQRYEERLARLGCTDRPGMERAACDCLADAAAPVTFLAGVQEVRVDDLFDLTPVQFEILLALARRVGRLRVTFPYNPDRAEAYRFVGEHTLGWFEALGEEKVAERIDPCFRFREERRGTALDHVLEHIFRGPGDRPPPAAADGTLRVIAAPGPAREVEQIGREVRALLDEGMRPDAVGVVFRNLATYGRLVEEVFTRLSIPLVFRRGEPVTGVPVVRTLLAWLEAATGTARLDPDRMIALLASAYLDLGIPAAPADVEEVLAAAGILTGPLAAWDEALGRLAARRSRAGRAMPPARDRVEAARSAVTLLSARLVALAEPRSPAAHAAAVRQTIADLGVRARVRAAADIRTIRRDLRALAEVDALLDEIVEAEAIGASPARPIDLGDFVEILRRGLADASVPGDVPPSGGVRVLNALDARGLEFDAVCIGGLVEGDFPLAHREPMLFTDEERELFRDERGRRLFRSTRLLQWEDPLLFCLALSTARHRVVLTYPTVNARGDAVLRSYFVDEVLRLLAPPGPQGGGALREVPLSEVVPPVEEALDRRSLLESLCRDVGQRPAAAVDAGLAAALRTTLAEAPPPPGHAPAAACFAQAAIEGRRERFFGTADPGERATRATPWTGLLAQQGLDAALRERLLTGPRAFWSATHLEQYANCPFSFFMEHLLGLHAFERPDVELSPRAVGTLAHSILERFFAARKRPEKAQDELAEVARAVFGDWAQNEAIGDPVFWEMRKREILAVLRGTVEHELEVEREDPKLVPTWFEFSFGFGKGEMPAPYEIDVPGLGPVRVRGKIDRVDVGPDRVRVVDYKYSRSKDKFDDATAPERVGVLNFQLPLYLLVMSRFLGAPAERIGGIFLLREPRLRTQAFEETHFAATATGIGNLVTRALAGRFDVTPDDCPVWCPFRSSCRYYLPLRGE